MLNEFMNNINQIYAVHISEVSYFIWNYDSPPPPTFIIFFLNKFQSFEFLNCDPTLELLYRYVMLTSSQFLSKCKFIIKIIL